MLFRKLKQFGPGIDGLGQFHLYNQMPALYLVLNLAKHSYGSRYTTKIYQETGIGPLLAYSGLRIGLIHWIIPGIILWLDRLSNRFFEHHRFYGITHLIYMTGIWLYLLIICIPNPVFSSFCMLSLLVAGQLLGQVHHPLYTLFATAFFFIFL